MTDRLGVTMRSAPAVGTGEERDAIARDWYRFLASAVPELPWVLLPNVGGEIVALAQGLGVNRLLLTGGEDPGTSPARDATERALLEWAIDDRLPVFGVCRGLQFVHCHFGGELVACDRERHVARRHPIRFAADGERERIVNSFHGLAASRDRPGRDLEAIAFTADGGIEALRHRTLPVVAVQWHPEREPAPDPRDVERIRRHFGLSAP